MADRAAAPAHEPGLAALLAQLFHHAETLLLQQLALLRAELGEYAGRLVLGALTLAAGIAVALIGGLALVAALILLLGRLLPLWAASALVGAVIAALIAALGAALVFYGRRLIARASLMPRQRWQALRDTGDWLRQELT